MRHTEPKLIRALIKMHPAPIRPALRCAIQPQWRPNAPFSTWWKRESQVLRIKHGLNVVKSNLIMGLMGVMFNIWAHNTPVKENTLKHDTPYKKWSMKPTVVKTLGRKCKIRIESHSFTGEKICPIKSIYSSILNSHSPFVHILWIGLQSSLVGNHKRHVD